MKTIIRSLLVSTALGTMALTLGISAGAHHSFSATFQEDAKITVEGVVTKFNYKNPHVLVYFDVTNDDGSSTEWIIEGAAATLLRRSGWTQDTITPGMYIRATGDSTHDGSPMVTMDNIDLLDSTTKAFVRTIEREQTVAAPYDAQADDGAGQSEAADTYHKTPDTLPNGTPNISGGWATGAKDDTGRPRRPDPNYNAVGAARQAGFELAHDPQVFCDSPGLVRQSGTTPHPFIISQTDDAITIRYEEYGGTRIIPFSDTLPEPGVKTRLGDSVARIEGNKIIIETINLLENLASPEGTYLSDGLRTVETLYRDDDAVNGGVLQYEMISYDDEYLNEPMRQWKTKGLVEGYEMIGNDCQSPTRIRTEVSPYTSFFLTSIGPGDGGNLGGLAGADAHCESLAASVGQGAKGWRAYLSTTGTGGVNAIDRIGAGPWYNPRGELIAATRADIIAANGFTKATSVSERGEIITGRADDVNRHDILTGTQNDGMALDNGQDTTCSNWTSNSDGTGSALAGHHDRTGGGADPESWTHAHGTRGCSQENLQATGGDGLFYCFATQPFASGIRDESGLSEQMKAKVAQARIAAVEANASGMGGPPGGDGMGPRPEGDGMGPRPDGAADGNMSENTVKDAGGSQSWMLILGALFLAGLGIFFTRRNKN